MTTSDDRKPRLEWENNRLEIEPFTLLVYEDTPELVHWEIVIYDKRRDPFMLKVGQSDSLEAAQLAAEDALLELIEPVYKQLKGVE